MKVKTLALLGATSLHNQISASSCVSGESNCLCDSQHTIVDCSNESNFDVNHIQNIPDSVKNLDLSNNDFGSDPKGENIEEIGDLTELVDLKLNNCKIKALSYDLFDNLDNLINLDLNNNYIEQIDDDTFEWNPLRLESLILSNNRLKYIQHFLFYDLNNLQNLALNNNKIAFIHPHAFQKLTQLRSLDLSNNHLKTFNPSWINPFKNIGIRKLNFKSNPWSCDCSNEAARTYFKDNFWLDDLSDAKIVCNAPEDQTSEYPELNKLQGQELKRTTGSLPCAPPKIVGISKSSTIEAGKAVLLKCIAKGLPKPSIAWIAPDKDVYRFNNNNFEGVSVGEDGNLRIENLSKESDDGDYICQATNFQSTEDDDEDDKNSGPNVAQVKMNLKIVDKNAPNFHEDSSNFEEDGRTVDDRKIDVNSDEHRIYSTAEHCPSGCTCQNHLIDCTYPPLNNKRSQPLQDFPVISRSSMKILETTTANLYLDGNQITFVPADACDPFTNLAELRMESNQISTIDQNAWSGCYKLQLISLRNNKLDRVSSRMFTNMPELENIVLDENPIMSISNDAFKSLQKLRWVYVRKTNLQTVATAAFHNTPSIQFIHFEDNKLSNLETSWFDNLQKENIEAEVFLEGNPVNCNCELLDFYKKRQEYGNLVDFFEISCAYPARNQGYLLNSLSEAELTCESNDEQPLLISTTSEAQATNRFMSVGMFFFGVCICVALVMYAKKNNWFRNNDYQQMSNNNYAHLSQTYEEISRNVLQTQQDQSPLNQTDREVMM